MLRGFLVIVLLGCLSACTGPVNECQKDGTCLNGGVCDPGTNLCFVGLGENDVACEPRCAAYQACATTTRTCVSRYTGLVVTPESGTVVDGDALSVRAELRVAEGFAANYPERLSFNVAPGGGGPGMELTLVTKEGEGVYAAQWTPQGEGVFRVTAAHPEAGGPSASVNLTVDTTAPVFQVTVPTPDAGVPDGGAVYTDPAPGFATAWRRDQVVPVEVRTNEPNLEPGSVTVALQGTDGVSAPAVSATPFSEGCTVAFCGRAELKLWQPTFGAFRSALPVVIQGRDKAGNIGGLSQPTNVSLTRWKWVFDVQSGVINSAPAIGQQGWIYLGTTTGSGGRVFTLRPDGSKQWDVNTGVVVSGPVLGSFTSGEEIVYVGVNSSSTAAALVALSGTGAELARCPVDKGQIASSLALTRVSSGSDSIETALGVINVNVGGSSGIVGSLLSIRPVGAASMCYPSDVARGQLVGGQIGPLVVEDDKIFFADSAGRLVSYQVGVSGVRAGWPVPTGFPVNGLALVESNLVGANGGGSFSDAGQLFSVPKTGGVPSPPWRYPSTSDMFVNQLSVGQGGVVFFGSENLSGTGGLAGLGAIPVGGSSLSLSQTEAGSFKGAPSLDHGGLLYTANNGTGLVGAWSTSSLDKRWTLSSDIGSTPIPTAIDCSRDASGSARAEALGVLYVAEGSKLYAFVVDSRGLDSTAPWPKYQHDARNTGNPATPITSCPAP